MLQLAPLLTPRFQPLPFRSLLNLNQPIPTIIQSGPSYLPNLYPPGRTIGQITTMTGGNFTSLSLLLLLLFISSTQSYEPLHHLRSDRLRELFDYDPIAAASAQVVVTPHVRISVLTDRVVRIEESSQASTFEDRATLAVMQRRFDPPHFTVTRDGTVVTVVTEYLKVRMDTTSGNPVESVQISSTAGNTAEGERTDAYFEPWHLGADPSDGNLLGTIRTLDALGPLDLNCNEVPLLNNGESLHCRFGVVSRKGWAVLNDTANPRLNPVTTWWEPPESSSTRHDLYFFGFGRKYKDAIKAYTQVSGKPPMLPRASLGVWWTRWYNYDQQEVKEIYEEMENRRLPLDMLVLDMNWHRKPSWGGYSWDRSLFPFPDVALQPFKENGIPVMVNLHDDSGVSSHEETFAHFESYLKVQDKRSLKFSSCNNSLYAFGKSCASSRMLSPCKRYTPLQGWRTSSWRT